ncbi:MAG TPA: hypothetical protein VI603_10910 [Saprospiraceae bacterium]|nr:hypothetical protein [Saprospiraceae bacterium]
MAPKKKKSKPRKHAAGKAKGVEAHPSKDQKHDSGAEPDTDRSIPIGMPVSKKKFEEMKKRSKKID